MASARPWSGAGGARIGALGVYRDAVRSSRSYVVKASGLRWVTLMWLGHIPWAGRHWALPFLTVLAPSERYYQRRGRPHKKLTDWARQMVLQLRRWLPNRPLVLVGDSGYAVLDLLHFCQSLREPVTFITRLRLDAGLYAPAPPRRPGQNGRPRVKGARLPTLKELLDQPTLAWTSQPVGWYDGSVRTLELASQTAVWYHSGKPPVPIRWVLVRDPEASWPPRRRCAPTRQWPRFESWSGSCCAGNWKLPFQEVRAHLGVETQRQWSDRAITRTTPALMGLLSWITLAAHSMQKRHPLKHRRAAWYPKTAPTFVDAIALLRRTLWLASEGFSMSPSHPNSEKVPTAFYARLIDSLAYAA